MKRASYDALRKARSQVSQVDRMVGDLVSTFAQLCAHDTPDNHRRDTCPGCRLWNIICDVRALTTELAREVDTDLLSGPDPTRRERRGG